MTQHMEFMDFGDEEEQADEGKTFGYLELLPEFAHTLGWQTKEFKDGKDVDR